MPKFSVLDQLGWIAFAIVVIYFILKIAGIISSPFSFDLIALVSGAFFIGKYAMKIDYYFKDVKYMKYDIKRLDNQCPIFEKERTKTK